MSTVTYRLPLKLESYISILQGLFKKQEKILLQQILVNSTYSVHEGVEYDNWNGGTYGHSVFFEVPRDLYYSIFDKKEELATEITSGLNKISQVQNEFVTVFLEPKEDESLQNWRESSGALIKNNPYLPTPIENQVNRIWPPETLRLFISHKSEEKEVVAKFKNEMSKYGISCFVAHQDIEPTKEWQKEIEEALFSMDVLIAWLSPNFSNSSWTDQEIGVAVGRGVLVIPIRLGCDPYGFIGKYQAVSGINRTEENIANHILDLLWKKEVLKKPLIEGLIQAFEQNYLFSDAAKLIKCFEKLENLSQDLIDRIENAPKNNPYLAKAYVVTNKLPGLIQRLRKISVAE